MLGALVIDVVVPARDHAATLPAVLKGLPARDIRSVVVVDRASRDRTAEVARDAGALVLREPSGGYGAACQRAQAHFSALPRVPEIVVFVMFNYYGLKENGFGYIKHLAGPWISPFAIPINILIFCIELLSTCIRPLTLSIRLMVNMAVDHMLLGLFAGLVMLVVPVPLMVLGTLVALVQTLVFCLLTAIYISLATEHEDHGEAHAH